MRLRAQSEISTPKTAWDYLLEEMKWLRDDFRCEPGRKQDFFQEISGPCMQEAHQRLENLRSTSEGEKSAPEAKSSVAEWARQEYLVQISLRQDKAPQKASEAKMNLGSDVNAESLKQLPARKKNSQSVPGMRRSKRLRKFPADADEDDSAQND